MELVKLLLRLVSKGFGRSVEAGAAVINEADAGLRLVEDDFGAAVVDAGDEDMDEAPVELGEATTVVDEGPETEEPNGSPPVFCRRQRFSSPGGTGGGRVSNSNSSY